MTSPTPPRLSTLDADRVALDAASRVVEVLSRLAMQVSPGVTVHIGPTTEAELRATQVYLSVVDLVSYAQLGGADEELPDLLLSVLGAVAFAPVDARKGLQPVPATLVQELDEDDPLALACVAAWARYQVNTGQRINGDQLAALAGLSAARIRALREAGEVKAATEPERKSGTLYAAKEVRRFLSGRGVPGYCPTVKLSPEAFARLQQLTEEPAEPTPALREAAKLHAEWAKKRGGR